MNRKVYWLLGSAFILWALLSGSVLAQVSCPATGHNCLAGNWDGSTGALTLAGDKPTIRFDSSQGISANEKWLLHVGSFSGGGLEIFEGNDGLNWANRMVITPSGDVGLGTSSPTVKLHVIGDFIATGTKSALVETASYGDRHLYAMESPENWFEDFGGARLNKGRAVVKLDPIFAETVSTDIEYHVFLTPRGNCRGLYVANQTPTSFEVRELQKGTGNIAFDYRIVAKRKGYEKARLAKLEHMNPETLVAEVTK